ncbi:MAG: hypothetical protein JNM56_39090 [Planctomycetia bacterium]|nr:hypothetical protein [Planctomycetia bacterium]
MNRQRQRLVAVLSLVAFLLATTPGGAVALQGLFASGSVCSHAACAAQPEAAKPRCQCCHHHDEPDLPSTDTIQPAAHETPTCPTCPHCPRTPGTPHGCAWCSVAKAPGCVAACDLSTDLLPALGARLVETALLFPPVHCAELIRPPRS